MSIAAGRVAIVTGAAQGLGRAIAGRLLEAGATVVGVDLQGQKLEATRAGMGAAAERFRPLEANIATPAGAAAAIDGAVARFGRLDILVNTAGGSGMISVDKIEDISDDLWNTVLLSNLGTTFYCARAAVPHMRHARYGRIVNFSSGLSRGSSGKLGTVGCRLAYASAKGAIESFTRQLALDLAEAAITVNVILPGFILTEPGARVHERFRTLSDADKAILLAGRRIEDLPKPIDIAEAVAYLVSDEASHVTGAIVDVGGR